MIYEVAGGMAAVLALVGAVIVYVLGRNAQAAKDANVAAWRDSRTAGQLAAEHEAAQREIDEAAKAKTDAIAKAEAGPAPEDSIAALANTRARSPRGKP